MSPVDSPAASSAAAASSEVVVFPSVPVIPMTGSSPDGSPYHQAADAARAGLAADTIACGSGTSTIGRSTTAADAPAAAAAPTKRCPSLRRPGMATNVSPRPTRRES
jgi:hypothetical protein